MGIWRQNNVKKRQYKEAYSLFENNDPFDDDSFLGTFRPAEDRPSIHRSTVALKSPHKPSMAGYAAKETAQLDVEFSHWHRNRSLRKMFTYVLFALLVAGTGFAVAKFRPWTMWGAPQLVYAYFEVRAVDGAGRPVAGAIVKNAGKKVGTTDSFGEWRRYIRVPLGSTVPITIFKTGANSTLYATKNFAVPPEKADKNDMELRASVQLLPGGAAAVNASAVTRPDASKPEASASSDAQKNLAMKSDANEPLVAVKSESMTTPVQANATETANNLPTVETQQLKFISSHESIWFEVNPSSSGMLLQNAILPALVQRAKELGLKVEQSSPWKVRLNSVVEPPKVIGSDGGGLIQITSVDEDSTSAKEFLRNYQSDSRATARGILYVLSHHVSKNVAVFKQGGRWVAGLPKNSPEFWHLAGGMSLQGSTRVWLTGVDAYSDTTMQGFYLQNANESPCGANKQSCEVRMRTFAEVPAVPTWSHLKLKLTASTHDKAKEKDSMKVFVSGYEAKPTGDNVFEYWGQDRAKANVTVIQNGRLLQRLQVTNDARQAVAVAMGLTTVSRR